VVRARPQLRRDPLGARIERIGQDMNLTPDPVQLFSERIESYVRFVRCVR
jgi:hypothetical protein